MCDVENVVEAQERQERDKFTATIAELEKRLEAALLWSGRWQALAETNSRLIETGKRIEKIDAEIDETVQKDERERCAARIELLHATQRCEKDGFLVAVNAIRAMRDAPAIEASKAGVA